MAIVFQTSFDHYTTITHRFNSSTGAGPPEISAGTGRNSTNSLRFPTDSQANPPQVAKTLPAALTDVWFAFAYKTPALPPSGTAGVIRVIAAIRDAGVVQDELILLPDGTLKVRNGAEIVLGTTSDFSMLINTWYHIEWYIRVDNSAGLVQVRINEVEKLNVSSQDTQFTTNNTISEIVLKHSVANAATNDAAYFDDVAISNSGFSGDVEVGAFLPTGVGSANVWSVVGASSSYEATDETTPNSNTDYINTTNVGDTTLFTYASLSSTSVVHAVVPLPFAEKEDAGSATIASVVKVGSTSYTGASKAPSLNSYEYHPDILMTNPATGITWTYTEWNSIEIGPTRLT
jgi:hypothetical protein